jgi:hypothetical protein
MAAQNGATRETMELRTQLPQQRPCFTESEPMAVMARVTAESG